MNAVAERSLKVTKVTYNIITHFNMNITNPGIELMLFSAQKVTFLSVGLGLHIFIIEKPFQFLFNISIMTKVSKNVKRRNFNDDVVHLMAVLTSLIFRSGFRWYLWVLLVAWNGIKMRWSNTDFFRFLKVKFLDIFYVKYCAVQKIYLKLRRIFLSNHRKTSHFHVHFMGPKMSAYNFWEKDLNIYKIY